jgi:NitT/TauT family transport system substrate-binding protein
MKLLRLTAATLCLLAAPAFAAGTEIALPNSIGSAPIYVGLADHAFADQGLEVRLRFLATDEQIEEAVAKGDADLGVAALTGGFFAYAAKHDLRIIAPQYADKAGFPAAALLVGKAAADAGLNGPRGLASRRIAIPSADSGLRYQIVAIARKYNVAADTITFVPLGTQAALDALAAGQVDAAALPYVIAYRARAEGKGTLLLRLSDEVEAQRGVIFTRAETILNHHREVDSFIRAYRGAAIDYYHTFLERDDAGDMLPGRNVRGYLAVIAPHSDVPPEHLPAVMPYCDHLARLDVNDLDRQLRFWQGEALVDPAIGIADLIDVSFNDHIGEAF